MGKHVVASVGEIAPGGRKLVELEGRPIVVFNLSGEYFALLNRCPHQGGSLYHGRLTGLVQSDEPGCYSYSRRGEIVRCPWHAWEFDIRTGKSWCEPRKVRVKNYPVSVEPGAQLVEGPYTAETFPVRIEDSYVVVEV
ncbi:MAG TPA: Rieske (2Fe-2S) protein [Hyphomicrobiaceae bacterium]|jgi:nitrite reductase/ring-hydroxylating ferredoxin subunit|nr:Rieske (2Fe-2S) protein [Hyphomicrobiaceae bacterium]